MNLLEFSLLVFLSSWIAGFLGALTGLGGTRPRDHPVRTTLPRRYSHSPRCLFHTCICEGARPRLCCIYLDRVLDPPLQPPWIHLVGA
jgi:hypothetical protein